VNTNITNLTVQFISSLKYIDWISLNWHFKTKFWESVFSKEHMTIKYIKISQNDGQTNQHRTYKKISKEKELLTDLKLNR
jgi:hypothetical protein